MSLRRIAVGAGLLLCLAAGQAQSGQDGIPLPAEPMSLRLPEGPPGGEPQVFATGGVPVVYRSSTGGVAGVLEISPSRNGTYRVGESVSGNFCGGSVAGTAVRRGDALVMSRSGYGQTCVLTIRPAGKALVVGETGCSPYHGGSCDFVGKFFRSR
jgi:hypothetical protein